MLDRFMLPITKDFTSFRITTMATEYLTIDIMCYIQKQFSIWIRLAYLNTMGLGNDCTVGYKTYYQIKVFNSNRANTKWSAELTNTNIEDYLNCIPQYKYSYEPRIPNSNKPSLVRLANGVHTIPCSPYLWIKVNHNRSQLEGTFQRLRYERWFD